MRFGDIDMRSWDIQSVAGEGQGYYRLDPGLPFRGTPLHPLALLKLGGMHVYAKDARISPEF